MLIKPLTKIELSVGSEFPGYAQGNSVESAYFNCSLRAPMCLDGDRKPVDIVVVLDRSGSMAGQKLDLCKKTIQFLMSELSPFDRLGLVTYDTNVRTEFGLMKMDERGKGLTERTLKKIRAGNCTNLSGGLMEGIEEVQKPTRSDTQEPNPVRSVLILTDGLANSGMTKTQGIVNLAKGILEPNVSIFTFGYGSDHNVDMLRAISEVGSGVYYFVQNVDGVSLAFADCLGGILSVVAQNIKVECFGKNGCTIRSIKTRKPTKAVIPNRHYEVELGDLYGEEERDVLIEVSMPPLINETLEFEALECKVRYANVLDSSLDQLEARGVVRRANKVLPSDKVPNSQITQQRNRIIAAEAMERASVEAERGRLAEGITILQQAMETMTVQMNYLTVEDSVSAAVLIEDLKECKGTLSNRFVYKTRGKMRMKAKLQTHWNQRSNDAELAEAQILEECDAYSTPKFMCTQMRAGLQVNSRTSSSVTHSGYRNSKKKMMMKKSFGFSKGST